MRSVVDISLAKTELPALVEQVQRGGEVILANEGVPVAKIVRYGGLAAPRTPGSLAGQIWIAPDFDKLPDDMAEAFGIDGPER